jgi:hypothetical protein
VLAMQQIRQPLSVSETIEYANSLIKGSEFEEKINEFKLRCQIPLDSNPLGIGWWRGFSKRFKEIIVTKKGEKFAKNRSDWSTESNIRQMYDEIYHNMVEAGIAVHLDDKVWMNSVGDIISNEEKKMCSEFDLNPNQPLGLQCDTQLIHPQYLLFFDETGCNTNKKKTDIEVVRNLFAQEVQLQSKWFPQPINILLFLGLLLQQVNQFCAL